MTLIVLWILFGIVGAAMLSSYGKAGTGCLLGGLLGPLGLILAWVERSNLERAADLQREAVRAAELRSLVAQRTLADPEREERDCPFCAERILERATVCKHCGRDVRIGVIQSP